MKSVTYCQYKLSIAAMRLTLLLLVNLTCDSSYGDIGADTVSLSVCYNFGCRTQAVIQPTQADMEGLEALFVSIDSARLERAQIRLAIARLEQIAARYLPTGNDVGGNYVDGMVDEGKQDCIDESTNTTTYLTFLERQGWLHWHTVEPRIHRSPYFFDDHWAAQIRQKDTRQSYAVDSWFYDNGEPPIIETLTDWQHKRDTNDQ